MQLDGGLPRSHKNNDAIVCPLLIICHPWSCVWNGGKITFRLFAYEHNTFLPKIIGPPDYKCVFSLRGKRLKIRTDATRNLCDMECNCQLGCTSENSLHPHLAANVSAAALHIPPQATANVMKSKFYFIGGRWLCRWGTILVCHHLHRLVETCHQASPHLDDETLFGNGTLQALLAESSEQPWRYSIHSSGPQSSHISELSLLSHWLFPFPAFWCVFLLSVLVRGEHQYSSWNRKVQMQWAETAGNPPGKLGSWLA